MAELALRGTCCGFRQVQDGTKQVQQAVRRVLRYDEEADEDEVALRATQRATSQAVRSSWLFSGFAEEAEARDDARCLPASPLTLP